MSAKGLRMRGREAVTERVGASQAKRDWSKVINRAFSGKVRFVVEKHGTPVAGIVSADDVERAGRAGCAMRPSGISKS